VPGRDERAHESPAQRVVVVGNQNPAHLRVRSFPCPSATTCRTAPVPRRAVSP
jgi:hypothetical protein